MRRFFDPSASPPLRLSGTDDPLKRRLLAQLAHLHASYSDGGLPGYVRNARRLLAESAAGTNPFDGVAPSVPAGDAFDYASPAYRAAETKGAQLAGRAGRGSLGGKVMVQTTSPEVPVLRLAARHDADGFLSEELERRESLGYPPAVALVRVYCAAESVEALDLIADTIATGLDEAGVEVLGPAPLFRLKGKERRQLVARHEDREILVTAVDRAIREVSKTAATKSVTIGTEVDAG